MFVPSNHQTRIFFSFSSWKLVQNRFVLIFRLVKSWLSFSTAQLEKKSWKKLGKTRFFVVWWFDVTNKTKSEIISEWHFDVFKSPKKWTPFFWQISALNKVWCSLFRSSYSYGYFKPISGQFFANHINIFLETEVQFLFLLYILVGKFPSIFKYTYWLI